MEGSICLRNDGRYMARFYENGRQKCFYGKTKKEAVEKLKKALNEKKKAEKEKKEKSCYLTIKFSDFSQDFLEIFKKPILKKSTFHSINNKLKRFSQENLYKMKMRNITYFDLNNFYEKIDINYTTYLLFKEIFEKAKEMGIIEINPFCLVVKPKNLEQNEKNNYNSTENKQIKDSCILSNEEINQILNFDYKENK